MQLRKAWNWGAMLAASSALLWCGGTVATGPSSDGGGSDAAAADGGGDAVGDDTAGFGDVQPCYRDATFPPDKGAPFACGNVTCWSGSQYCFSASAGKKRGPNILGCMAFLECGPDCADATPSCACTAYGGSGACACSEDGGDFFVTCSFP